MLDRHVVVQFQGVLFTSLQLRVELPERSKFNPSALVEVLRVALMRRLGFIMDSPYPFGDLEALCRDALLEAGFRYKVYLEHKPVEVLNLNMSANAILEEKFRKFSRLCEQGTRLLPAPPGCTPKELSNERHWLDHILDNVPSMPRDRY